MNGHTQGECRRFPPALSPGYARHVDPQYWCGEFKAATPPPSRPKA